VRNTDKLPHILHPVTSSIQPSDNCDFYSGSDSGGAQQAVQQTESCAVRRRSGTSDQSAPGAAYAQGSHHDGR